MSTYRTTDIYEAENYNNQHKKSNGLHISRFVNGTPATLQQLISEHTIQNDAAMQVITSAISRANNPVS